jgi:hypothetical protein
VWAPGIAQAAASLELQPLAPAREFLAGSAHRPDILIYGFAEFNERAFAFTRSVVVPLERELGSHHFHFEVTNGPRRDSGDLRQKGAALIDKALNALLIILGTSA